LSILGWIVVGFVAGALAKAVVRTNSNIGCLGTIAIGVVGGLIGGALFNLAGDKGVGDFGLRSMFVAFIGAVILLGVVNLFARPRSAR
jgi:uncharacterized membrane protein YeaQ/YmgE (transglycosylase-associated protein family)